MVNETVAPAPLRFSIAAWAIAALLLYLALRLHLLPALLAGLLVYELVHVIALGIPLVRGSRAKLAAVGVIATVVVLVLVGAMFGVAAFLKSDAGSLGNLLQKMAEIVEAARGKLPAWLIEYLPSDADAVKESAIKWLRENAVELRTMGGQFGHAVVHIIIGMVIGGMVSLHEALPRTRGAPLATELTERADRVGDAFRRVVFAQVRISLVNTVLTAIYLLGVLPLLGIDLPFVKTLVLVTFLAGLLPVIGNLISNTVIVVVSLAVSLEVAMGSLAFLVIVHKLEYFLNARIVGTQIRAKSWELLLAMLVMESAFGLPGLVAAPIYYAYLKDELAARGVI